ncbi:MAG: cyclophilin-like fold protein [Bilifractor sp.]|jgi:hypothetical protein
MMVKVDMISRNTVIQLEIDDSSQTAKDFLALLPMKLTMNNWDDREYYGVIQPLHEDGSKIPTYQNGDVTYYTAGKSLAVFFAKDDRSSQTDLIRIGRVTSDLNEFRKLGSSVQVTIQSAES